MTARNWRIYLMVTAVALLMTVDVMAGGVASFRRNVRRQGVADHVVAFAALQGADSGWGRFEVRDDFLPSGEHRSVKVWLFDLAPEAEYTVEANGVEVGIIMTDHRGAGHLKLQTQGRGHDPVPPDLPPASALVDAVVSDGDGFVVLEGEFRIIREQVSDPAVYCEKIRLEDVTLGQARGYAGVVRKMSGAQIFATMATGLVPQSSYRIVVDDVEVAIVVADDEGQASLELHAPGDENLLPVELMPVDEIYEVQWRLEGQALLLEGFFTGESDCEVHCDTTVGTFAGPNGDNGFLLQKGDLALEIVVNDDTEFEGFEDLSDLEMGDWLKVDACWDGEQLVARSVELKEPHLECHAFPGTFAGPNGDHGFLLQKGDLVLEVVVTDDTEFQRFDDLSELGEGDKLVVFGCRVDDEVVAKWVKRVGR